MRFIFLVLFSLAATITAEPLVPTGWACERNPNGIGFECHRVTKTVSAPMLARALATSSSGNLSSTSPTPTSKSAPSIKCVHYGWFMDGDGCTRDYASLITSVYPHSYVSPSVPTVTSSTSPVHLLSVSMFSLGEASSSSSSSSTGVPGSTSLCEAESTATTNTTGTHTTSSAVTTTSGQASVSTSTNGSTVKTTKASTAGSPAITAMANIAVAGAVAALVF